jgi:hypothetical protein
MATWEEEVDKVEKETLSEFGRDQQTFIKQAWGILDAMFDEQRLAVFSRYCQYCGILLIRDGKHFSCYCIRDE